MPSTLNLQSSTLNPDPSTLNPQPSKTGKSMVLEFLWPKTFKGKSAPINIFDLSTVPTLETATRGQISIQSATDATRFRWLLYGS